jgi:hypothetical protein
MSIFKKYTHQFRSSLQTIRQVNEEFTGNYDIVVNWPTIPRGPGVWVRANQTEREHGSCLGLGRCVRVAKTEAH